MKIFIPRVPQTATNTELKKLVSSLLEKKFRFPFTQRPSVAGCDILQFRDANGVIEYHGLVTIHPDDAGSWLLSHFKGQKLHNKQLFARQFMDRNRKSGRMRPEDDRRRVDLKISKVTNPRVAVEAMDSFRREYSSG